MKCIEQFLRKSLLTACCVGWTFYLCAQQIDVENFGKDLKGTKAVRIGGGISANTLFYHGNDGQGRQPFTYILNGNINFNFFNQINIPFTFNLTNAGNSFTYPTMPTRLSIHPKYKWVTAHIGDVAMSFSPYTLNGHMFRGAGVDLTPEGRWKFSAMGGRLQRSVEYNREIPMVPAAYERMGYGAKVRYDEAQHYLGMTLFAAKDDVNSLRWKPDSLNIHPKSNVALSWEGGIKLFENLHLSGEYAISMLTRDVRAEKEGSSFVNKVLGQRTSTEPYRAMRAELAYVISKNTIGVGYERIDPEYATLGSYYFNNDYENVTLRYARPLFKDRMTVALSGGLQRDDLDNNQEQSSKRFVSSANVDYRPNEKLSTSLSYSSFQTYMNVRSQFDYINEQTPYDNLDTLNFTQLSQNVALNVNYSFGKNENRKNNFNANLSVQEAADQQGGIIRPGGLSRFYNLSTAYNLMLVPANVNIQAAFNTTYNYVAMAEYVIVGPTLGIRSKIFRKKITTGLSCSYNVSFNDGESENKVLNLRWNAQYTFMQRHNLNATSVWQKREMVTRSSESVTATFGYAYSF